MAVVVPGVDAKDANQVPAAADQEMVQALPATVPTQRSATALALGAWIGVRMTWAPTARQRSSKTRVNLLSRSRIRNRMVVVSPSRVAREVAGLLGDPCAGGVGGDTREVDSSGVQPHEEQHLQPLPEHGVHGEQVARQDAGCLLA